MMPVALARGVFAISVLLALLAACARTPSKTPGGAKSEVAAHRDRLPEVLNHVEKPGAAKGKRGWTVQDVVEIREITGVAVSDKSRQIAFILKQPYLDEGDIRYGLYVTNGDKPNAARKLIEAAYLGELSWHPGSDLWTVRADFGTGVQLYDIDGKGASHPLVVNPDTALVGGNDGVITSPLEGSRQTGVLAYEWAPDGSALWYSRLRLRAVPVQRRATDSGIVYDAKTMMSRDIANGGSSLVGTELRLLRPDASEDRELAFVATDTLNDAFLFSPQMTSWLPDSRGIQYAIPTTNPDGEREFSRWNVDVAIGKPHRLPAGDASAIESIYGVPMPGDGGYLTVKEAEKDEQRLVAIGNDGKIVHSYGPVDFRRIGAWSSTRSQWSADGKRAILGVQYRDREGLFVFPESPANAALGKLGDHLSHCTFTRDLAFGACVRENLALPQELVAVVPDGGTVKTLVRPSTRFDEVEPLRSERVEWVNRFDSVSDGYITYPRGYVSGKRYPVVIATHGSDAQNKFAYRGFQWEFPVQVFAESGYLVLSVNDPCPTDRTRAARDAFIKARADTDVSQMQFYKNIDALAGMEAALQSVVEWGLADPERTGIAGYSRGCEVVEFALSQSKLFKVGSDGDAGGWNPGGYWLSGSVTIRGLYHGMFGGSPYDPKAIDNYRKYSAAFRAKEFAGPLLQQSAGANAMYGLDLNTSLQDAGVPVELAFYPGETHIFWHPRRRAAAMQRNLDWFNYWLLDKRDPHRTKQAQYRRWDAMAKAWKETKAQTESEG